MREKTMSVFERMSAQALDLYINTTDPNVKEVAAVAATTYSGLASPLFWSEGGPMSEGSGWSRMTASVIVSSDTPMDATAMIIRDALADLVDDTEEPVAMLSVVSPSGTSIVPVAAVEYINSENDPAFASSTVPVEDLLKSHGNATCGQWLEVFGDKVWKFPGSRDVLGGLA